MQHKATGTAQPTGFAALDEAWWRSISELLSGARSKHSSAASSYELLEYLAGRDDQSHLYSSGSDAHIQARAATS